MFHLKKKKKHVVEVVLINKISTRIGQVKMFRGNTTAFYYTAVYLQSHALKYFCLYDTHLLSVCYI